MGSQSLSPRQTQARPSSMGTNPSNPSSGSNNGGLASSTLPGGGLGRYNSLARQSSIYSLTLDEFQNTMTEPGKNFGSMNMDEFLKNIWTAEESQAMAAAMGSITDSAQAGNAGGMLTRQPSLGAMSLPRTLSRKTVDQVWRDIHRDSSGGSDSGGGGLAGAAAGTMPQEREATFGEMTLEDFLVKAGVVREDAEIGSQGFSPFVGASVMTSGDIDRSVQGGSAAGDRGGATGGDIVPTLSLSPANVIPSQASIDAMQMDAYNKSQATTQQQQADWFRSMAQQQQQHMLQQQAAEAAAAAAYVNAANKRMGNGAGPIVGIAGMGMGGHMGAAMGGGLPGGMHGAGLGMGLGAMRAGMDVNMGLAPGSTPSPESDGGHNGLSLSPMHYGLDGPLRGRKRGPDGPVEKVVERRQRRMIKNRESAARSRARKQAYQVELEAEVNQLKEENLKLRKQQEDGGERRKKQLMEMMKMTGKTIASEVKALRRTRTATW
ncbi:hypothetical protein BDL97_08G137900 [Sphagnum fallax]|nr:hypothetical protein BDL97_08G137900 [Sphagnum fallax]